MYGAQIQSNELPPLLEEGPPSLFQSSVGLRVSPGAPRTPGAEWRGEGGGAEVSREPAYGCKYVWGPRAFLCFSKSSLAQTTGCEPLVCKICIEGPRKM